MFRFVSFSSKDRNPTHVYVVCDGYILDCCADFFNEENIYEYFKDVNPQDMAINRISGVRARNNGNNKIGRKRLAWVAEGPKNPKNKNPKNKNPKNKHGVKPPKKLPQSKNLIPTPKISVNGNTIYVKSASNILGEMIGLQVVIIGQNTGYQRTVALDSNGATFDNLSPDDYKIFLQEDLGILGKEYSDPIIVTVGNGNTGDYQNVDDNNQNTINYPNNNNINANNYFFTPKNIMIGGSLALFGILLHKNKK